MLEVVLSISEQTDGRKWRQTLSVQVTKNSLSSKGINAKCRRLINDLIIFHVYVQISREFRFIHFVYNVKNIPNRICQAALPEGHRSSEELSIMSKNNFEKIAFGIRPMGRQVGRLPYIQNL